MYRTPFLLERPISCCKKDRLLYESSRRDLCLCCANWNSRMRKYHVHLPGKSCSLENSNSLPNYCQTICINPEFIFVLVSPNLEVIGTPRSSICFRLTIMMSSDMKVGIFNQILHWTEYISRSENPFFKLSLRKPSLVSSFCCHGKSRRKSLASMY